MHWQFTPDVFFVITSAVISAVVAGFLWRRRLAPGAIPFSLLMLAVAEWSAAYALELLSHDLPSELFWDNVSWLGAALAPTLWLAFVLRYTGRTRWLTRRTLAMLAIEPLITLILVWASPLRGFIEYHFTQSSGSIHLLNMNYGMWYWFNIAYSYFLLFVGAVLIYMLIQTHIRSAGLYHRQAAALLVAVLAPWVGNALTVFGWNPLSDLDLTPFAFMISGVTIALSLFRFRLLDIIPVAREAVFENMSDAVIVLDEQSRIVDINPAARQLTNGSVSKLVGQPFTEVFAQWPQLVECYRDETGTYGEVALDEGEAQRYFDVHISYLYRRNGHLKVAGRLVVLNEITEHIQTEKVLRESEERFRNVFEEAPIGMAVIGLDGLLLQVNKAFCEMLGYAEEELRGRSLSAITHRDDVGKDALLATQMLKGAITSYRVEKRYLRKDQETLWADLTSTILRDQDGQAIYGLIMLENIIARKRAKLLEEEKHHVAYELHDGLAQVAASAHQHLQAFASHYRPYSQQARKELYQALELAQRSVREARRLIAGLRPTALDDFGLATALRLQVEAQRAEGWTINYEETLGSERLSPTIENTLYGVAREALNNARKHAGTKQARIAVERQDSMIRLEVQDWGCGFEPSAVLHEAGLGEHIGLREMQERVELVGGHLTIASQPEVGTRVVAEVPLLSSIKGGKDEQ
ncbi:MAG: PAS domain S-box protein [Chloroflexi bacterium]|nr:PAS domain S-box protein [Chloroflexota bacterium]